VVNDDGPRSPFITAALDERDKRAASPDVSPFPTWTPQSDIPAWMLPTRQDD